MWKWTLLFPSVPQSVKWNNDHSHAEIQNSWGWKGPLEVQAGLPRADYLGLYPDVPSATHGRAHNVIPASQIYSVYPAVTLLNSFTSFKRIGQNQQEYWTFPCDQTFWVAVFCLFQMSAVNIKLFLDPTLFLMQWWKNVFGLHLNSHGLKTFWYVDSTAWQAVHGLPHFPHHSFLGLDLTLVFEGDFYEWPAMIYCQSLPDIWKGLVKEYREKELQFSDKISHETFKLTLKGAFQIFKENLGFFSIQGRKHEYGKIYLI